MSLLFISICAAWFAIGALAGVTIAGIYHAHECWEFKIKLLDDMYQYFEGERK